MYETEQLIKFKLDIKNTSAKSIYIQYKIFNPFNYQKMSLEICNNIPC